MIDQSLELKLLIEGVAIFLGGSFLLYVLLGGADFGAGILELFVSGKTRSSQKKIINEAMGPVWEVNHIWLVVAVVILFNAFPKAFAQISVTFHIPLTLMLIGIIFRGCAFTFRNYDAYKDKSQKYYSMVFSVSSLLTPFSMGLVLGGILSGRVNPKADSFYAGFIDPWLNVFSFVLGIFICCLFTYIASIFLIGEAKKKILKRQFILRAKIAGITTIIMGGAVIVTAFFFQPKFFAKVYADPISVSLILLAVSLVVPLWILLNLRQSLFLRFFVSGQVALVFLAWCKLQYPFILVPSRNFGFEGLSIYQAASPEMTLKILLIALVLGSIVIFPAWFYLLRVFKFQPKQ